MTEKDMYNLIHEQLYKEGSCSMNQWYSIYYNGQIVFEAMQPNRGNIRVRKPIKEYGTNAYGETVFLYKLFRFTNKQELKDDGYIEGLKSEAI